MTCCANDRIVLNYHVRPADTFIKDLISKLLEHNSLFFDQYLLVAFLLHFDNCEENEEVLHAVKE